MSDQQQEIQARVFKTGKLARTMRAQNGSRLFHPFRVELEVQLSELALTSDTLTFYLYQENPEMAVNRAHFMMQQFYQFKGGQKSRFPRPVNEGRAYRIEDSEFLSIFRTARASGRNVRTAGSDEDPVAFEIVDPSPIYTFGAGGN